MDIVTVLERYLGIMRIDGDYAEMVWRESCYGKVETLGDMEEVVMLWWYNVV
jgi:hypothetical protein